MNAALERLASLLGGSVARDDLINALYAIRAPRNLAGIIPIARRFREWRSADPKLAELEELPDYAGRLQVLDRIANIKTDDATLTGRIVAEIADAEMPLYPLTGDSVIGELLLTRTPEGLDAAIRERVSRWLIRLVQRFHVHTVEPAIYAAYLTDPSTARLKYLAGGDELYRAHLTVRKLFRGGAYAEARLNGLAEWLSDASALGRDAVDLVATMVYRHTGAVAKYEAEQEIIMDTGRTPREWLAHTRHLVDPVPVTLLALIVAAAGRSRLSPPRSASHSPVRSARPPAASDGPKGTQVRVHRGAQMTSVRQRAEEDGVHAGTVVEFSLRRHKARTTQVDPDDDDPEEEPAAGPAFSLFLADSRDLIKGYYASKAIQNSIEYRNAQLRWSHATLSRDALNLFTRAVAKEGWVDGDALVARAWLALGVSLLTGRPLEQVASASITAGDPQVTAESPVVIQCTEHRVCVRPGRPDLARWPAKPAPFCRPLDSMLSLPLPEAWYELVDVLGPGRPRSGAAVARQARRELGRTHKAWQMTEERVRYALERALIEQAGGDRGVAAVLTAGTEGNARNVIHYASYGRRALESQWRCAVESLVGALPEVRERGPLFTSVGSQHAFDLDTLAKYFGQLKRRIAEAVNAEDWPRAFNRMTLYLSYWLGLGLAQRRTLDPVPGVVLNGGWALLADKHHADDSTDRVIPITTGLQAQIEAYVAFASALAIDVPELDPIVDTEHGTEVRLQYIGTQQNRRRGVVRYQPKYQEQAEQLPALPANWGRKVVRSHSDTLPGRYRDAELGHFVRGRHAWDTTSTFNARDFHVRWLKHQRLLERRLGFEVVAIGSGDAQYRERVLRPAATPAKHGRPARDALPPKEQAEVEGWLRAVDAAQVDTLSRVTAYSEAFGQAALALAERVVWKHESDTPDQQLEVADAVCKYMRVQWRVPLFLSKPRPLFAHHIVLDSDGVRTLACVEHDVLPAFERDLACLPARPEIPEKKVDVPDTGEGGNRDDGEVVDGTAGVTNAAAKSHVDGRQTELGRLLMLGIWRLGLTRWGLLESWLRALCDGNPVWATRDSRYLTFAVRSEASHELTQRTVWLDPFTATYLVVEHDTIRNVLLPSLFRRGTTTLNGDAKDTAVLPRLRRGQAEAALRVYLRFLDADTPRINLSGMMIAATQRIMLNSAPVIAAYARGTLLTEDLDDWELRRLAGLQPARKSGVAAHLQAPQTAQRELGQDEVPADVLNQVPLLHILSTLGAVDKPQWRQRLEQYRPTSALERLLRSFALWLPDHADVNVGKDDTLGTRRRRSMVARVEVIAYALLGYASDTGEAQEGSDPQPRALDGDTLTVLQEASREQFPDRLQHGAWYRFHNFLNDAAADHAGFTVRDLGPEPESQVSAKILSGEELAALQALLPSVQSGIPHAEQRMSVARHVDLMATFGMRRSESAYLRSADFQGDLCRVQAYGRHTLKTAWANRVLPMAFAEPSTQNWAQAAWQQGFDKLIDPDAQTRAVPDNFFNALSRLIKDVTGDDSMGSHHLRHTLINRIVLTLLWDAASLEGIKEELPWLEGLRLAPARMRVLLGAEGDAGQGLRALAALVGHSHPTTTLRHYVHVIGIALHGTLRALDTLDISRSFELRIGGKSTMQRWAKEARDEFAKVPGDRRYVINVALRNRIEQRFQWAGEDRDETPRPPVRIRGREPPTDSPGRLIGFGQLERVDQSLREGSYLVSKEDLDAYRMGLEWLASIRTGKKGAAGRRHVLTVLRPGVWLPPPLRVGSATRSAVALCEWLEGLRAAHPDEFAWLLKKWTHASERERGRMRLVGPGEVERAQHLPATGEVRIEVRGAAVSKARRRPGTHSVPRMRIKCLDATGQALAHDTAAVRWVLSYVCARWGRT
ncbi:MAG TPA: hypothetical protein VF292_11095 [Rhodanobacteraceae bacterium]